ncbi:hypothetical protein JCM16106_03700 [Hydrogenophilus islandicus]
MNDAELSALYEREKAETLAAIEALLVDADANGWSSGKRQEAVRLAHSLKGAAASMGERAVATLARLLEERLAKWPESPAPATASSSAPSRDAHPNRAQEGSRVNERRWRVAFTPTPILRSNPVLQEELDRSLQAAGALFPPDWRESPSGLWEGELTTGDADERVIRNALELFALPGTVTVALSSEPQEGEAVAREEQLCAPQRPPSVREEGGLLEGGAALLALWSSWWQTQKEGLGVVALSSSHPSAVWAAQLPLRELAHHWQQAWQAALPQWQVRFAADTVRLHPDLAAQLDRWQKDARTALASGVAGDAHPHAVAIALRREGALLWLTVSGDPEAVAAIRSVWDPEVRAHYGRVVSEAPSEWVATLPFAPGLLWAFALTIDHQRVVVAAETVAAFFPEVPQSAVRQIGAFWTVTVGGNLYRWQPLLPEASRAPWDYPLLVAFQSSRGVLLTGVDYAERAQAVFVTPLPNAPGSAPWVGVVTERERLATVIDPERWWPE